MEYAINESTGQLIWRFRWQYYNSRNNYSPLYYAPLKGIIYVDQFHVQMLDTKNVTVYNANLNTTALNTNPPAKYGPYQPNILWDCYVGREMQATPTLAMIGPSDGKIYISTDSRQIFCLNATNGKKLGFYQNSQLSNGWSAAAVWEGKMYVGNADNYLYAFADNPKQNIAVGLSLSKFDNVQVNEPVTITGTLSPILPNITFTVSFIKPDFSQQDLTAKTNNDGAFTVTYTPTSSGTYSVTGWWSGYKYYAATYSDMHQIHVVEPAPTPTPVVTEQPTPTATEPAIVTATPTASTPGTESTSTTTYAIVAVIVIIIIAAAAAIILRKRKTK